MNAPLEKEFYYFLAHQDELVEKYNGKVVSIVGTAVVGVYDTEIEAFERSAHERLVGTFLIQRVLPGPEAYTRSYYNHAVIF